MNKSHLIGALCAVAFSFISMSSHAVPVYGQGTWETTLKGRDLDGNQTTVEAYYDTVLNITWLADVHASGPREWNNALAWPASLDFGPGIDNWRLPTMIDTGSLGCDFAYVGTDCGFNVQTGSASTTVYSEMASMFYDTLGNLGRFDTSGGDFQPGWGLTNTGEFINLDIWTVVWTNMVDMQHQGDAWVFYFDNGHQTSDALNLDDYYGWAVHEGDVGAAVVPIPPALYLFGSGLLGLIGVARKKAV